MIEIKQTMQDGITFNVLELAECTQMFCRVFFPNGYGLGIFSFKNKNKTREFSTRGSLERPYEITFLKGEEGNYLPFIPYWESVTTLGYQNSSDVHYQLNMIKDI